MLANSQPRHKHRLSTTLLTQAIGQAVERLRRQSFGGTAGTASSTPKVCKDSDGDIRWTLLPTCLGSDRVV